MLEAAIALPDSSPFVTAHAPSTRGGGRPQEERPLDMEKLLEGPPLQRRHVRARQSLFHAGQPRQALYLIHAGFFKTSVLSEDGREKITGFRMRGDLLGIDALDNELTPHALFNPPSNQKLFTTLAALTYLGEDFDLSTIVRVDTARRVTAVQGRGDPLLSSSDLDSIARTLTPMLPPGRLWKLVCDVSYFDDVWWGSGWAWDHEPDSYAPFITPLILDRNTVQVSVSGGDSALAPPSVAISPPTAYVSVENGAVTVSDSVTVPLRISRRWKERSNTLTVTGQIRLGARREREELSVWQPERYAATVLAERLRDLGASIDSIAIDTAGSAAPPALVFTHRLDSALTVFNKVSDNLTGEVLLKVIASQETGPPGTSEGGIALLNELLARQGTDTNRIVTAHGSGLAP